MKAPTQGEAAGGVAVDVDDGDERFVAALVAASGGNNKDRWNSGALECRNNK